MSLVIDAIMQFSQAPQQRIAIVHQQRRVNFRELWDVVQFWRCKLHQSGARTVACRVADRLQALEIDLACQAAGLASLILPSDCSAEILRRLVLCNGIELVLTDRSALCQAANLQHEYCRETGLYSHLSPVLQQTVLPDNCAMLSLSPTAIRKPRLLSIAQQNIDYTTASLARLRVDLGIERHLSLPFASTLSETLTGQYATLISGGCCFLSQQPSIRHCSQRLIDDCLHFLSVSDVQSVLIPAQCRRSFLQFAEKNTQVVAGLKMVLISGPPQADLPEIEGVTRTQAVIFDLWGTPGHALPYALLHPGAQYPRLLPHCTVSVGTSGRLYLHANASLVFDGHEPFIQGEQIYTGLTDFVAESNFLQNADIADRQCYEI